MTDDKKPARRGSLLYERDGDFNPGWLLVMLFGALGAVGCAIAFAIAWRERMQAAALLALAFGFVAFMVITAASMVVSIARARILNDSKVLQKLAGVFDTDERDEEQRARGD